MSGGRGVCVLFTLIGFAACAGSTSNTVAQTDTAPLAPVAPAESEAPIPSPTAILDAGFSGPEPFETDTTGTAAPGADTNEDVDPMAPTPAADQPERPAPPESPVPEVSSAPAVGVPQPALDCVRLTEFSLDAENFGWFIVNDNVMGGRSSGGPIFEGSAMVFEGEINTDGGGFSSVRAQVAPSTLAGYTHLIVRARPDGRTYKVTLEDALETRDRRVSQQQELIFGDPDDAGWQTARIDFDQLDPRIFGRAVTSDPFRPDLATQLGIMISDGVDGPFRIEIDWIDACRP